MRLRPRTFKIQWELHAWVGVTASLLLFVMFYCGVFALFRDELEVWQDPALHASVSRESSLEHTLELARAREPIPPGSRVSVSPHEHTRFVHVRLPSKRRLWIDPQTDTVVAQRSRLSEQLYDLHYLHDLPYAEVLSGVLAIALLITLASGLALHIKDLPAHWWRFRPSLRLRFSASDAHKLLGLFGLPFTVVIAWSGAVLCLGGLMLDGVTATVFDGDEHQVMELRGRPEVTRTATHQPASSLPLDDLVARAQVATNTDARPYYTDILLMDDANAWARVYFRPSGFGGRPFAWIDAVEGDVIASTSGATTPAAATESVLFALHFARYGDALLELLYAVLSLAVCAVIVTGNLVWVERRDPKRERRANRLLERLTVGFACGLALASAAYFLANRPLDWELSERAQWETRLFFGTWLTACVASLVVAKPPRQLAAIACAMTGSLFSAVVVLDLVVHETNLWTAIARDLPAVFICEALLTVLAVGSFGLAWATRSQSPTRHASD